MLEVGSGGKLYFWKLAADFMVWFERFRRNFPAWNSTLRDLRGPSPHVSAVSWEGPGSGQLSSSLAGPSRRVLHLQSSRGRNWGSRKGDGQGTCDAFMLQPQPVPVKRLFSCSKDVCLFGRRYSLALFFFFDSCNFLFHRLGPIRPLI